MPRVLSKKTNLFAVMMFAMFALALVSCVAACANCEVSCCEDEQATECICLCQTPAVVPNCGVAVPTVSSVEVFLPVVTTVKSREVVASIFNPPKL